MRTGWIFIAAACAAASAASWAWEVSPERRAYCEERRAKLPGEHARWLEETQRENRARALERTRLAAGMGPFVDLLNAFYADTRELRPQFAALPFRTDPAVRAGVVRAIQGRALALGRARSGNAAFHVVFAPDQITGGSHERPGFFVSFTQADPAYDRDTRFRDPQLPRVPNGRWERLLRAIDLDAPEPRTSQRWLFHLSFSDPVVGEQEKLLVGPDGVDRPWNAEDVIAFNARYGYDYLKAVPERSLAEFLAERIPYDCRP
jgi:hypothetical protein